MSLPVLAESVPEQIETGQMICTRQLGCCPELPAFRKQHTRASRSHARVCLCLPAKYYASVVDGVWFTPEIVETESETTAVG